jgi:hypothetical protein
MLCREGVGGGGLVNITPAQRFFPREMHAFEIRRITSSFANALLPFLLRYKSTDLEMVLHPLTPASKVYESEICGKKKKKDKPGKIGR